MHELFGHQISVYTRKQALEDGTLVDVSKLAKECGFRYPVAVTQGVWGECVSVADADSGEDETGRLWEILFVLKMAIRGVKGDRVDFVEFGVTVQKEKEEVLYDLYAVVGPGDDMEPVITVMLIGED